MTHFLFRFFFYNVIDACCIRVVGYDKKERKQLQKVWFQFKSMLCDLTKKKKNLTREKERIERKKKLGKKKIENVGMVKDFHLVSVILFAIEATAACNGVMRSKKKKRKRKFCAKRITWSNFVYRQKSEQKIKAKKSEIHCHETAHMHTRTILNK